MTAIDITLALQRPTSSVSCSGRSTRDVHLIGRLPRVLIARARWIPGARFGWTPALRRALGRAIRPNARAPPSSLVKADSWIVSPSSSSPEPIDAGAAQAHVLAEPGRRPARGARLSDSATNAEIRSTDVARPSSRSSASSR